MLTATTLSYILGSTVLAAALQKKNARDESYKTVVAATYTDLIHVIS